MKNQFVEGRWRRIKHPPLDVQRKGPLQWTKYELNKYEAFMSNFDGDNGIGHAHNQHLIQRRTAASRQLVARPLTCCIAKR